MNQKAQIKKSKRNTSRSTSPVRQTSSASSAGTKPGTPVFSYPDEPQAFPIHDTVSASFPTDQTSYAQKKDIDLFTPLSGSDKRPASNVAYGAGHDAAYRMSPPRKRPSAHRQSQRISSSYTTVSDSAFQPTEENEAYAREITLRRREERRQAEQARIRQENERIRAEEEHIRQENERIRAEEERIRAKDERIRAEEERRFRSADKARRVERKKIDKTNRPRTAPDTKEPIPPYLQAPRQPQAFHEIPAPVTQKKKRKKPLREPQLSDYQPLLDYEDEKKQPDSKTTETIRVPVTVRKQVETVTDLQDVIPVKEGTGDIRPHVLKKERESRRKRDERLTYLLVIFVIIFAVSAFFLFRIFWRYKKASSEYAALEKDYVEVPDGADLPVDTDSSAYAKTPYPNLKINFPSLYAINNDLLGWIYVPGCGISYPLVKGTDNEYYLSHTFEKKVSDNGAVFMDYQDKSDFSSFNTFIYGHDMRDGSMFASLFKYGTNADLIASYPYFFIYLTNGNVLKYHICSFYTSDGNSDSFLRVDSAEQKTSYVAMILAKSSLIKSEATAGSHLATADDTFVTLSTCHGTGQRFLVHAYLEGIYNTLTNSANELY